MTRKETEGRPTSITTRCVLTVELSSLEQGQVTSSDCGNVTFGMSKLSCLPIFLGNPLYYLYPISSLPLCSHSATLPLILRSSPGWVPTTWTRSTQTRPYTTLNELRSYSTSHNHCMLPGLNYVATYMYVHVCMHTHVNTLSPTLFLGRPNQINWQLMVASCHRKTGKQYCMQTRETSLPPHSLSYSLSPLSLPSSLSPFFSPSFHCYSTPHSTILQGTTNKPFNTTRPSIRGFQTM